MITLTTPPAINSVIGGNLPVSYDKFKLTSLTFDTTTKNIVAVIEITSTSNPDMTALKGRVEINFAGALAEIQVQQLDFYRRIRLSGLQQNAVSTIITNAQNDVESGLISLGLVSGTQALG